MQEIKETQVQSLGWEDPLQKVMAIHSNIFAWRFPGRGGAWRGYSQQGHKESCTTEATEHAHVNQNNVVLAQKQIHRPKEQNLQPRNKPLNDPDNHNCVITHLEADILEYEVKWALGSITTNRAGAGDGIPAELFQTIKDDAVKVLH